VARYFIFLHLLSSLSAGAQVTSLSPTSYFSQVNCYSKLFVNAFSIAGNAASIQLVDRATIGVASESRFMIEGLNQFTIAGAMLTKLGHFGFQINFLQYAGYYDAEPAIAYSKKLGDVFLAVKFNYHSLNISGYGKKSSFIPEIGSIWRIRDNLYTGIKIYHPVTLSTKNSSIEKFGYCYSTGLGYEISPQVLMAISFKKQEQERSQIDIGFQYHFSNTFFAGIGIDTREGQLHFSTGWRWKSMRIDAQTSYHLRLGFSPGLALIYTPGQPEK
jgi:hypothetical protein